MPYVNKKRPYKKERLQETKARKDKRNARNRARYKMAKGGEVKVGDGKDVDHKIPLSKGGTNKRSNLRVQNAKKNRSYKRTSSGKVA